MQNIQVSCPLCLLRTQSQLSLMDKKRDCNSKQATKRDI